MKEELRAHVEELFRDAPQTKQTVEIKEEILQNTIDRYNDLVAEGKDEQAAFNISVAGIGDVNHLISSMMAPVSSSGYSKEELQKNATRRAVLLAVAVGLYICCVLPPIIFDAAGFAETLGVVLMFLIAAIATGIIIYRSGTKLHYNKSDDTVVENFKQWNREKDEDKSLIKAVEGAVWALTLVIYFLISFATGAWYITWLTFIIGGAVTNIIRAIFDLTR